jgi:quinol monooxygenase YgiN
MAAFEQHAELPHTVRLVEAVEPLLDHPFKVTLSEQLW